MIVYLDLETTGLCYAKMPEGSDIEGPHQILSLGMLLETKDGIKEFYQEVYYEEYKVTAGALKVNGFDLVNNSSRVPLHVVEIEAIKFLLGIEEIHDYIANLGGKLIPVGFNVGSFDMQFIKYQMPELYSLFSYRAIDLNTLLFTTAGFANITFDELKNKVKEEVIKKGIPFTHHTLEDCRHAYHSHMYILDFMQNSIKKRLEVQL